MILRYIYRECVRASAAGARTHRSLEHHLLHPLFLRLLVLCAPAVLRPRAFQDAPAHLQIQNPNAFPGFPFASFCLDLKGFKKHFKVICIIKCFLLKNKQKAFQNVLLSLQKSNGPSLSVLCYTKEIKFRSYNYQYLSKTSQQFKSTIQVTLNEIDALFLPSNQTIFHWISEFCFVRFVQKLFDVKTSKSSQ